MYLWYPLFHTYRTTSVHVYVQFSKSTYDMSHYHHTNRTTSGLVYYISGTFPYYIATGIQVYCTTYIKLCIYGNPLFHIYRTTIFRVYCITYKVFMVLRVSNLL